MTAKYGAEMDLERLLELLAADCQWMRPSVKPRNYEARCAVRFSDIDHGGPPPDMPPAAVVLRIVGNKG